MKIVVTSDTHHNYHILKKIVELNPDADLFIHLGDGENEFLDVRNETFGKQFVFVKGNGDFGDWKESAVIGVNGYKIYCTHGNKLDVANSLDLLLYNAKKEKCKIALFGHTHIYMTDVVDGIYVMNPGSPESPRNRLKPSYGVINIDTNGIIDMKIVEIKRD